MNKQLLKGIRDIQRLERKALPYRERLNSLYNTCSPNGGMNGGGVWIDTSNKLYRLAEQKAVIWNSIRNSVVGDNALWALTVQANMDVVSYGQEEYLKITSQEILSLLPKANG